MWAGYHKSQAAWYSLEEVEAKIGEEWGPHDDMVPTMQRILADLNARAGDPG